VKAYVGGNRDLPVVSVAGAIDRTSSNEFGRLFRRLARRRVKGIILDLAATRGVDTPGVATLLLARRDARRFGSDLHLAAAPESFLKVLALTRLPGAFRLHPTVDNAQQALAGA
jgi:anti-anti-sigma factor